MNKKLWKRLACVLLCLSLWPAALGMAVAEGMLPSGLEEGDLEGAVDAYVEAHWDTTAAVSIAVTRGQHTLLEKAYGLVDREAGRAADADTVYEWGSATKLLTWVSVMQLAEQGKLDLETDVRGYLPDNFFHKLKSDAPITMLNLMHHNAGWEDSIIGLFVEPSEAEENLEQALRRSEPHQIYQPGEVCAYSNWGVALAGLIVERVSGESFDAYVRKHIFQPLGMERTALLPTLEDNAWVKERRPLSQGYAGLMRTPHQFAIPLYPAGMATGTLRDFLLFAQGLLPEEGAGSPLFAKADTLSLLLSPSMFYENGDPRNSHGFWAVEFGVPVLGHGGNTAAFSAFLQLDPESRVGFVVMTNQAGEIVYNYGLPELIYGTFAPVPSGVEMSNVKALEGFYRSSRTVRHGCGKAYYNLVMTIFAKGSETRLEVNQMGQQMAFEQVGPDLLVAAEGPELSPINVLHMERTADGGARLAMPYFEFTPVSTGRVVWDWATIALLGLAFCYSAVALLGGGGRWVVLRLQKRRGEASMLRKYHLPMCVFTLAEGINIAWMAARLMSYASPSVIGWHIGFTWLYAAAAACYLALMARHLGRLGCGWKEKALYACTGLAALVVLMNIVLWQLYRF